MSARLYFVVVSVCLVVSLASATALPFRVVDTAQATCYNDRAQIPAPKPGEPFFGQDAQFQSAAPSYDLSPDKRTVLDKVTGLTWQRSPDTDGNGKLDSKDKLTFALAKTLPARLNSAKFGGFSDWRLPSIKELYSLFDARGIDPSGPMDVRTSGLRPFIDNSVFEFAYGDPNGGERVIDSQYATATLYVGKSPRGDMEKLFGVNFADGRIKGYDLRMPGGRAEKTFFVMCVRGNPAYGRNDFHLNADQTVTDRATGLVWAKEDSGRGLNWKDALAWVGQKNTARYLGHSDWRLPNVKELQSIIDYTRSPDTTSSAAIDPVFNTTAITNEVGQMDFPFYWSSTTHVGTRGAEAAMYVCFGRSAGWMSPMGPGGPPGAGKSGPPGGPGKKKGPPGGPGLTQGGGQRRYVDIHGAGAQRSDPKSGRPSAFPYGRGPQGDVIRIYNFVRLVRGGD
jgi:hypothetical protein